MIQKRKLNYYVTQWGELWELEQNPCGCHPFDVIVTYEKKFTRGKGNSITLCFSNQQQITGWARRRRLERLK